MLEDNFEEIVKDHQKIIYHLIHKLGIRDQNEEFYQEGVIALWKAQLKYDSTKGKFSSYAYMVMEKALIALIHQRNRMQEKTEKVIESIDTSECMLMEDIAFDPYLFEQIKSVLTDNQMKWFSCYILEELSVKEIAEQEQVTIDAVKNWARLAKPKLRKLFMSI
ncbi:sigma-70 family RNA polymerase sigma factor [Aquibacillus salsiterrae]|uniref:Sigma-70 family RNA polymerase sigma factor n=1 Tax=Aquibacillus salsiterrae TaxID=2950439 RepID=A0A9X3WCN3_9BACI|nr:sigma-70 family RNA polymerase sigma factor [Aquibacillus salsiterrae]MDC3415941.1 sigma-70 family RNA polymerase sigma factor [Aquibacillus salsiterrae]